MLYAALRYSRHRIVKQFLLGQTRPSEIFGESERLKFLVHGVELSAGAPARRKRPGSGTDQFTIKNEAGFLVDFVTREAPSQAIRRNPRRRRGQ